MKKFTLYFLASLFCLPLKAVPTVNITNPCDSSETVECYIVECTYTNGAPPYIVPVKTSFEMKVKAKTSNSSFSIPNYPPAGVPQSTNQVLKGCQYRCHIPYHAPQCFLNVEADTQAYLNLVATPAHGLTPGYCEMSSDAPSKDFSCN